jgi:hypothetical protein
MGALVLVGQVMLAASAGTGQVRGQPARRRGPASAAWGALALGACASLPAMAVAQGGAGGGSPDRCTVIVTGTDARSRPSGVAECLHRTLVKVSGDPALADDPRVDRLAPDPDALAEGLAYLDRMSDIPHRDEQGSRDRPFDLVVEFDPARIDATLAALGVSPWRAGRPALVAVLAVGERRGGQYTLAADADEGERQREALVAAAERFGMRVVLPLAEDAAVQGDVQGGVQGGVEGGATAAAVAAATARRVRSAPSAALTGSLVWSDADLGWVGTWRLVYKGREEAWSIRGVSFDDAFRDAIGGAAARLSGHGPPSP